MRWTYEYREQMKEKVRSILVRKPNISQYELAKVLGIDKDVALRLKKQVIAENTRRVSDQKIDAEIGKMEAEYEQLALECWEIIMKDYRKVKKVKDGIEIGEEIPIAPRDKMLAVKAVIEARKNLFTIKFDAGVFSRKLGKLEVGGVLTDEEKELIKKAVAMDYGKPNNTKSKESEPDGIGENAGKDIGENK